MAGAARLPGQESSAALRPALRSTCGTLRAAGQRNSAGANGRSSAGCIARCSNKNLAYTYVPSAQKNFLPTGKKLPLQFVDHCVAALPVLEPGSGRLEVARVGQAVGACTAQRSTA